MTPVEVLQSRTQAALTFLTGTDDAHLGEALERLSAALRGWPDDHPAVTGVARILTEGTR